jgi:hypothetical protein
LATIVVHLDGQPDAYGHLTHQFHNFGEDVFRWVRDSSVGEVDLDEVDKSTNKFSIANVKASNCRRVMRWVQEEAVRQFLTISTEVL